MVGQQRDLALASGTQVGPTRSRGHRSVPTDVHTALGSPPHTPAGHIAGPLPGPSAPAAYRQVARDRSRPPEPGRTRSERYLFLSFGGTRSLTLLCPR